MFYKLTLITVSALLLSACSHANPINELEQGINKKSNQSAPSIQPEDPQVDQSPDNSQSNPNNQTQTEEIKLTASKVILKTSKGDIELALFPESAPGTVQNFLTKAKSGHYKDLTFHRVEDWVVQGGDPLGNGTGGGKMPTELSNKPFTTGSLGVARGQDVKISNDSQFFICTKDCSWLNGQYTNFGQVTSGMGTVAKIAIGDTITSITLLE